MYRIIIKEKSMQKICKTKKIKFAFMSFVFMLASTLLLSFVPFGASSALAGAADPFVSNMTAGVNMAVTAYKSNDESITTPTSKTVKFKGSDINQEMEYKSYAWKDVSYFKIEMSGLENLPTVEPGQQYEYSYSVTYIPKTVDGLGEVNYDVASILKTKIYAEADKEFASAATITDIEKTLYFYLDNNAEKYAPATTKQSQIINAQQVFSGETLKAIHDYEARGGWGIYVFSFTCSEKVTYGGVAYEVTPTDVTTLLNSTPIVVSYKVERDSKQALNAKWTFFVTGEYQFIDRDCFSWNIEGVGSDGTKYVLVGNTNRAGEPAKSIYPISTMINTKSPSITLDTDKEGIWTAYVKIGERDHGTGTLMNALEGQSEQISTIKPFSTEAIIWIVTGVTVVAVAIVAVIIIITIKKEKAW